MKKLFLVGALALFGAMNAQTSKGNWMVSGKTELGFNSTETKVEFQGANVAESKTTSFTLNPAASYFVIDNLAIGLGLGFNSSKTDDDKSNTFSVMPQATYFFTVDGNIKPYVEAGVGYAVNNTTTAGTEVKFDGLTYGAGIGAAYFVNQAVAFNLGVNYLGTDLKNSDNSDIKIKTNGFGASVGISVFLNGKTEKKNMNN